MVLHDRVPMEDMLAQPYDQETLSESKRDAELDVTTSTAFSFAGRLGEGDADVGGREIFRVGCSSTGGWSYVSARSRLKIRRIHE